MTSVRRLLSQHLEQAAAMGIAINRQMLRFETISVTEPSSASLVALISARAAGVVSDNYRCWKLKTMDRSAWTVVVVRFRLAASVTAVVTPYHRLPRSTAPAGSRSEAATAATACLAL